MNGTDTQAAVSLPEGLRRQFAALEQRLWRIETLRSACVALSGLLLSWVALFVSDRLWDTPVWTRVALTALGLGCLSWAVLLWLKHWVFQRRSQRALAILVQKRFRRLGDRLLGVVELADEKQRPAYFSAALYRAAINQVAAETAQFDFSQAVQSRSRKLLVSGTLGILGLAAIPLLISPAAALNTLHRWIAPAGSIERFTLVNLDGLPSEQIVPHGEAFDMEFSVRYRSFWKPRRAKFQFERQPILLGTNVTGRVQARLPGEVRDGILRIALGDARAKVPIKATYRPSLAELSASVQLPAYLQYPPAQETVAAGSLRVLEGSKISFKGKTSRELAAAQLRVDQDPQDLQVHGDQFITGPLDLESASELAFTWRDRLGLESAGPWRLQLQPIKDSPPAPQLPELRRDTAILQSEVLEIKAIALDDFGVRNLGLTAQLLTPVDTTNSTPLQNLKVEAPDPREKKIEQVFQFSPTVLNLPADSVVELHGFATDFYPDRPPSETPGYRIHILGNEQHAELVRQNLESLLTRLEEVTRLEEKVSANTRDLQQLPKDKLKANEAAERIASAKEDQNQNAANLDQLAKEGKETLREAFRNPLFTENTLRDWVKNLQQMQQLSEQQMQQAMQALKSAQQNAEARAEHLGQAQQKEEEILESLEKMQRNVNKGLDQLQALTLAQRLRKIAGDEKGIAGRLQRIVPDIIGMLPTELPVRFKDAEAGLADEQQSAQKETQELHGEIGRFFERTQKELYGKVHKEMADSHAAEELDRLRGLIQENISMDAVQNLDGWSQRLKAWADVLEPKSGSSGGGGGGGGGGGNKEDEAILKELMGLLRARDRELNLRQRTGLLDKQKEQNQTYQQAAKELATSQGQVKEDVTKIQGENPVPALEFPLQDIVDAMQGAQSLLDKPQTDQETDLAQAKALQQLSDVINLINEQQQRSNSSSSSSSASAEEMAFLMQMMAAQNQPAYAKGLNPHGGGNLSGGTTDRAATPSLGSPNARGGESRSVNHASGSSANFPTEFRDALENYFKAVEKLK